MHDIYINFGSAVKHLGNGKIGGYAVVFSTADDPDLVGDYFDTSTWFGDAETTLVFYDHGLDTKIGKQPLGKGKLCKDDVGVWFEAQLERRSAYLSAILDLIEAGALGLSSGTAAHLVEREPKGKACHIKSWPLGLDVSLTPELAEPRTSVIPLKSYRPTAVPALQAARGSRDHNVVRTGGSDHDAATARGGRDYDAAAGNGAATATHSTVKDKTVKTKVDKDLKLAIEDALGDDADGVDIDALATKVWEYMESAPVIHTGGFVGPGASQGDHDDKAVKAFNFYLRTGRRSQELKATLVEGTDTQGGYLVPVEYLNEIVHPVTVGSALREAGARVTQVSGADSVRLPIETFTAAATIIAENAAYTAAEPTFIEIEFKPYKVARLAKCSEEVAADSRFDLWSQVLAPDFVNSFILAENNYFTNGTGTGEPQGVLANATLGVTLGTGQTTSITSLDSLWDLYFALPRQYRTGAVFMMADATWKHLRLKKVSADANSREYLLQEDVVNGRVVHRLFGHEVIINDAMPAMAANARTILFGDFSRAYRIVDWPGLVLQRLDELYAANGQVGFRAHRRLDGRVVQAEAVVALRQSAM